MKLEKSIPILYSADVKQSVEYYTKQLDFSDSWIYDDEAGFGGVSRDDVEIFFSMGGQGHPGTWLFLIVDQVDDYFEKIKSGGAIIVSAPEDKPWNMRELVVKDPDGHIIRFGQRIECD